MNYEIEKKAQRISVEIKSRGLRHTELHEVFQRCREGSCDCPTDEYDKLDSMQIQQDTDRISIQLQVKPGLDIDQAAVAACLDHTLKKSEQNG